MKFDLRQQMGWAVRTSTGTPFHYRWITVFSMLLFSASVALAQETSWDNLRTLTVGMKIQVVDQNLMSQDGFFSSASEDELVYQVGDRQITIPKAKVLRVSSREHLGRGKKALIGLGIGAIVGAMSGAGAAQEYAPGTMALAGLLFGGFGAGVGAALPSPHPVIYRTEPKSIAVD